MLCKLKVNGTTQLLVLVLTLFVLSGCATFSGLSGSSSHDIDTAPEPTDPTAENETENTPNTAIPLLEPQTTQKEPTNLSTRLLVEEARELACTGALLYKDGNLDDAQANLEAAILNLQLADLPPDMQKIEFFQPYLPDQCSSVDLLKAYNSLLENKTSGLTPMDEIPEVENALGPADRAFIEMEIVRIMEILGENSTRQDELQIFTDEVEKFINYYLTRRRDWFVRSYYRMMKYRDTVDSILSEKRLPSELAYLAFIESGYLYRATSRSRARGIWQFIRSTSRNYGLKVGRGHDERLDPIKSTISDRKSVV